MWEKLPLHLRPSEERLLPDRRWLFFSDRRCRQAGVNPNLDSLRPPIQGEDLDQLLSTHQGLVSSARELFEEIHHSLPDKSCTFFLTDPHATVLDIFSAPEVLNRCHQKGVCAGASLQEEVAGTNAVSLALRHRAPVILRGNEHFCSLFREWYCVAFPIFSPVGEVLGCVDISMNRETGLGDKLPLVKMISEKISSRLYESASPENGSITPQQRSLSVVPIRERKLSPRQADVLSMVVEGWHGKEIASALGISPRTVESHLEKMRSAFGARTTYQLIALAVASRLVLPPPGGPQKRSA